MLDEASSGARRRMTAFALAFSHAFPALTTLPNDIPRGVAVHFQWCGLSTSPLHAAESTSNCRPPTKGGGSVIGARRRDGRRAVVDSKNGEKDGGCLTFYVTMISLSPRRDRRADEPVEADRRARMVDCRIRTFPTPDSPGTICRVCDEMRTPRRRRRSRGRDAGDGLAC
jgi:hypothetical protein